MKKKKLKCYIYIRVFTSMQVEGYSLEAQRERLVKFAEFQGIEVVREYCDAGKSGKLTITVLSAVAEIERENILVQTMEGRKQKAREGKWNGGQAPFGYELDSKNSTLTVNPKEAEIVRIIFHKFVYEGLGVDSICDYLNQHGYSKKVEKNELNYFARSFIMKILDNSVYTGKIAYGRSSTEKVKGSMDQIREQLRQVMGAKKKLTEMLDRLDVNDKHYDRKYQDMHDRLDILYDRS